MGLSTGGHLALLLAATNPADFQAVAAFSAPVDLTSADMHTPDLLENNLVPLMGGMPKEKEKAYRVASPLSYDLKGMPQVFVGTGGMGYMSPELISRNKDVNASSDVYGWGSCSTR